MRISKDAITNFDQSRALEWIDTNGLGGYASGTVSGANSRRYHGLLVAAMQPPVGRMNVLSKLDEAVIFDKKRFELNSNQYQGAIHPKGFSYLESFERTLFPEFYFKVEDVTIKKTIVSIQGENTTVIVYEVMSSSRQVELELLPLYSCRDFHSLSRANDSISRHYEFNHGVFKTRNYKDSPELFISIPDSAFLEDQHWYYNFEYALERYRGLEYIEDLYTHGKFTIKLKKGERAGIIVSTENPASKDAFVLINKEKKRREALLANFKEREELKQLALAADQFIVKRGKGSTIIAGYHWFADWGRDTMIALPGLCLTTGRHVEAKEILRQFAENVSEGMLPNRFPDYGEAIEYNTIDATLWFFQAVYKYYEYTRDKVFILSLLPTLKDIIDCHYKGTRYNIKVDAEDELLYGGVEGVQLTWMDAKVGDWVVTPRKGKPVEINALWYNALCVMDFLLNELNEFAEADKYWTRASKVLTSFNEKFWNKEKQCLYDFIDGTIKNDDIRPNQIYAVSLPFPLLERQLGLQVVETVKKHLLTSAGLRSLTTQHSDFRHVYGGGFWERDGAYHQGTVWSFLLGPYIDALMNVKQGLAKKEAIEVLTVFFGHLKEAGVGTVSEIFDGSAPHTPRGCIAQAWGVAEVLRVAVEHDLFSIATDKQKSIRSTIVL